LAQEIVVDTRELEAPEPIQKILETLEHLDKNTYIKMVHRMEPQMLYNYLDQNNLKHKTEFIEDYICIYIWDSSFNEKDIIK